MDLPGVPDLDVLTPQPNEIVHRRLDALQRREARLDAMSNKAGGVRYGDKHQALHHRSASRARSCISAAVRPRAELGNSPMDQSPDWKKPRRPGAAFLPQPR